MNKKRGKQSWSASSMERESALEAIFEATESELSEYDDAQDLGDEMYNGSNQACGSLEDGEIADALGDRADSANDLDAAIRHAKVAVRDARRRRPVKSRKKGKRSQREPTNDTRNFISWTCDRLKEPKAFLVEAAVQRLGVDVVRDLVYEVETIEKHGGQMTADGKRRRTPGGVLWNILRSRSAEDYKAIMAKGKDVEKQRKRKSGERYMNVDGQQSQFKRRRTDTKISCVCPLAPVKKTGSTLWHSRDERVGLINPKGDPNSVEAYTQVQCAWAEGVKRGKDQLDTDEFQVSKTITKRKPAAIIERLRVPVDYENLFEIYEDSSGGSQNKSFVV